MRISFVLAGAGIALAAVPALAQAGPSTTGREIVVTGVPLSETDANLKACIARHCPTDEDVRATLAHAENQFVKGDYKNARVTLLASMARNKGQAKVYPVPVSDLYRAGSRVAAHLGEPDSFRVNSIDSLDALKAGLSDTDPRVLAQRVEVGDMFAKLGRPVAAFEVYDKVAKQARALKYANIEAAARIRRLALEVSAVEQDQVQAANWRSAIPAFDRLIGEREPRLAAMAYIARVMKAQFLARHGDTSGLEAVMAEMRAKGGQIRPILLASSPIKVDQRTDVDAIADETVPRNSLTRLPMSDFADRWVDVSFWIKPDGTVSDIDVLRTGKNKDAGWYKPVLASIATRRYAPLALPADDPGLLRVERYTYTSFFDDTATGTHVRTRSGDPRIEMLDLTAEPVVTVKDAAAAS